jgi:lipid II:glycine glycyltransferase (peptidoglycan interpeptide bridge formation enzyme)
MSGLRVKIFQNKEDWNKNASNFQDFNYRQFWSYGIESALRIGAKSEYVGIYSQEKLIGLTIVRLKKIPALPIGIAYVNGGPIHVSQDDERHDEKNFELCLRALIKEYTQSRNFVLRIKCPVYSEEGNIFRSRVFQTLGFTEIMTDRYRTFLVDIEKEEDEIKASLHGKWRNQLNRAQKNDLEIAFGTDENFFQKFENMFVQLKKKKGFGVSLDVDFYNKVQKGLVGNNKFLVQIALKDGEVLSAHVGSYVGNTAVYLLGASTPEGNQLKASYFLQWHAILQAKQRGCKWYDLGGIDPEGNKGVFHFKKGFNGLDVIAAGPYEIGNKINVGLVRLAEIAYHLLNKTK